jgi:hypothetical protein
MMMIRALVGMGVALGIGFMATGCSSDSVELGSAHEPGIVTEPSYVDGDPDRPVIVGKVSAVSFFSDLSGGLALINIGGSTPVAQLNHVQFRVSSGRIMSGQINGAIKSDVSFPSNPTGLNGQPWMGELDLQINADGTAQSLVVQLVGLTGQDTRAALDNPWLPMNPGNAYVCITDNDCGLFGLQANTCVQNTCQALPHCSPNLVSDVICIP